jgi:hypothetical protein
MHFMNGMYGSGITSGWPVHPDTPCPAKPTSAPIPTREANDIPDDGRGGLRRAPPPPPPHVGARRRGPSPGASHVGSDG